MKRNQEFYKDLICTTNDQLLIVLNLLGVSMETGEPKFFLNQVFYEISRNSCTIPTNTLIHLQGCR